MTVVFLPEVTDTHMSLCCLTYMLMKTAAELHSESIAKPACWSDACPIAQHLFPSPASQPYGAGCLARMCVLLRASIGQNNCP